LKHHAAPPRAAPETHEPGADASGSDRFTHAKETALFPRRPRLFAQSTFLVSMLIGPLAAPAQPPVDLSGHWEGTIRLPDGRLAFDLDFFQTEGGWRGDISIPAQQVQDVLLADIRSAGEDFGWRVPAIAGEPAFRGTISEDGRTMSGSFNQSGQVYPFEMRRAPAPAPATAPSSTGGPAASTASAPAQGENPLAGFDQWVEKARADWKTPGLALAVIADDRVLLARGFGERDVEKKKPVTSGTLFAIGSCTKAFTTFVLATLVNDGLLDWDKPVTNYIPEFRMHDPTAARCMTPRDMVTHRSGLPRHDLVWYNSRLTLGQLVARLPFLEPNRDFRSTWQYNNLMFGAAGYLAEEVSGKTWEEAVRQRIFAPLGMRCSNFSVRDSQKTADFALPYEERDDQLRRMEFRDITNVGPAGSINSCLDDLVPWVRLHLNEGRLDGRQIIPARLLADLHAPHMIMPERTDTEEIVSIGYGLGWVTDVYRGRVRVHHGGAIDGFSALITMFPRERIGLIALTNLNGSALPGIVTRHAIDRLLKLSPRDWHAEALEKQAKGKALRKDAEKKKDIVRKSGTRPAHPLEEYAGDYEHPGYGLLKVALRGGRLEMTYNYITTPLEHWHYEVFTCARNEQDHTFEDMKLLFVTGMSGEVDAVQIPFERSVKDIVFTRRPDARLLDPKFLATLVGEYELGPQVMKIALKGNTLTAFLTGQPLYELVPRRNDTFDFKGLSDFSMKFILDDEGRPREIQICQPNGVFTATRKGEAPTTRPASQSAASR